MLDITRLLSLASKSGLVITACLLLSACAGYLGNYKVQAPFDSFMCVDSSLASCLALVKDQGAVPPVGMRAPSGFIFQDPDAGKNLSTSDGKYQCQYGTTPYVQKVDPERKAPIVFVSPIALSQANETFYKIGRARDGCARLIQAYNFQLDLLVVQDQQAKSQLSVQYLTARVEADNLAKSGIASENPTADDLAKFGIPTTQSNSIAVWLQTYRNSVTQVSEQLRNKYRQQSLEVDYKKQFVDAQLVIDSQLREAGRELFLLDQAIVGKVKNAHLFYRNGAWVRQGTDVMIAR